MQIAAGTELAEKVDMVLVDGKEVFAVNIDTETGWAELYDKETHEVKQVKVKGKIEIVWKDER